MNGQTPENLPRAQVLIQAIKAVFAATHGRGMTKKEETELVLPDRSSRYSI